MSKGKWLGRGDVAQLNDQALRIEAARRNWPWWKVAATADIAPSNLSAYRLGHKKITTDVIARLEKALGLEPGSLLIKAESSTGESPKAA